MADPRDLKFSPTDERLVGHYLRNRVYTGRDGFITDINLYEDEPWLLPHVNNDQFEEKRWFYFVVRTRRSENRPRRTVQGRGGSNGGTWTTTGIKKEILDRNTEVVIGYKTELAYHKKVKGKVKGDTTGWCMTEYWLASENEAQFQEVVLCHLRDNSTVFDQLQFQPLLENIDDNKNMVPNALVGFGVEGDEYDSKFGQQNKDMFDIDELLDLTEPLIFPSQDMIPFGEGEGLGLEDMIAFGEGEGLGLEDMEEHVDELEKILKDDHKATQLQQEMMDPYSGMLSTRLEMHNNSVYLQDSSYQEMSPYGFFYNTHGYEMQLPPPVTNGVNQDSCSSGATQEQTEEAKKNLKR